MRSRRTRLFAGIAMGAFAQLAAIGLLLASAWLIVRAAQHPPVLYLMVAIVSVRFFGISRSVFRYVERLITHDVALGDAVEDRVRIYRELDRIAPVGLSQTRRGDLVSRVVSDVSSLQDRLLRVRLPWWIGLIAAATVIGLVSRIDLVSGLVLTVCVVLCAVCLRFAVSRWGAARRASGAEVRGELATEVSQLALAAPDIVAFGASEFARQTAAEASGELGVVQQKGAWVGAVGSAFVLAATGAAVAVIAALSAGIDPVLVGVVLLAPIALAEPMDLWSDAERVRPGVDAAAGRLSALTRIPTPVTEPAAAAVKPEHWDLVVDDGAIGWDLPLVDGLSFRLPEGGSVAITGPSGVGKSTLAFTVLRLIEPKAGSWRLGGTEISALRGEDVRSVIGYLGQDDVVFDTSIRENLRIAAPDASDDDLMEALGRAGLRAFVAGLPEGLGTSVGEHGGRLSGGERQRLCLARLLLGQHRILVVDEPTEHLDAETAEALMDDLMALREPAADGAPGRSLLVISHAQWAVERCDAVVRIGPLPGSSIRV